MHQDVIILKRITYLNIISRSVKITCTSTTGVSRLRQFTLYDMTGPLPRFVAKAFYSKYKRFQFQSQERNIFFHCYIAQENSISDSGGDESLSFQETVSQTPLLKSKTASYISSSHHHHHPCHLNFKRHFLKKILHFLYSFLLCTDDCQMFFLHFSTKRVIF